MLEMQALAQRGARMRLEELTLEMTELQAFLDEAPTVYPAQMMPKPETPPHAANGLFTPQQRQAISTRMKAYWARRRASNGTKR